MNTKLDTIKTKEEAVDKITCELAYLRKRAGYEPNAWYEGEEEKVITHLWEQAEKRAYIKGRAFAHHLCDCSFCSLKNKEALLELKGKRDLSEPTSEQGGENANDRFERLAEEFYRDTGVMAPGKDDVSGVSREVRQIAWSKWLAGKEEV